MKASLRTGFLLIAICVGLCSAGYGQNPFKLKPGAGGKVCINCHDTFKDVLKKPFVHTPVKAWECSGCHDPHTSTHGKLLSADTDKICLKCHRTIVPEKARSVHKVVMEGNCVTCHDPHASANRSNLLKAGNDLCFGCHKEMGTAVAKAKFKHSPVDKGCVTCHDPHASAKSDHLLKAEVPGLCLGCHKSNPGFAGRHMNYPVATARCTSCHDPHGSNRAGIFFDNVHEPVAKRMCTQCHDTPTSAAPFKTKKTGFELCRGCHSTMMGETFNKRYVHWALLDTKGCLNCHEPHASAHKKLIAGDSAHVCGKCHGDTMAVQGRLAEKERQENAAAKAKGEPIKGDITHKPVQEGTCEACHSPHAADSTLLLKQPSVVDLCATCHDWLKHTSHPMGGKTLDARNKNLFLDCLSCHRSHGTGYRHLIPFPADTDLCTQCHKQFRR
jgi:predicted CXXCH cytochrome family protein